MHAVGQVASADLPATTDPRVLTRRLNRLLPADVRVAAVAVAPPGFDARFSALCRCYRYRVSDAPYGVHPLRRHDTVGSRRPLDVAAMAAAAAGLVGEHDFAAYCRRREGASTVRRLLRLDVSREVSPDVGGASVESASAVMVVAEADAFCRSMVRALVGALLAVGEGRRPVAWPAEVLAAARRYPGVRVAPAHGLTLESVRYPPDDQLAARAAGTRRLRVAGQGSADPRAAHTLLDVSQPTEAPRDREVEVVLAAYRAFAAGDLDAAVADLHAAVEWIEPDEFPNGGRHVGRAAVRAYLQQSRDSWTELHSTPSVRRVGERIVAEHHVEGVLADGTRQAMTVADVFTFDGGRVSHMRAYADPADVPK